MASDNGSSEMWDGGKAVSIALAAPLHAVPQTAPDTFIIDEALGSGGNEGGLICSFRRYF